VAEFGILSHPTLHTHMVDMSSVSGHPHEVAIGQACLRFFSSSPVMACILLIILLKWLYWLAVYL